MKQYICLILCVLTLGLVGCQKQATPTPLVRLPEASVAVVPATGELETTETAHGIVVTTPYYTVTLPLFWKDNYEIGFSREDTGYTLRFVESVSKEAGVGGHVFTLTVSSDMDAVSDSITGHAYYLGVLKADKVYAVTYWKPTDVQFENHRMELYNQMVDSRLEIVASLAAAGQGTVYYPTGAHTFEQRAALTTVSQTGQAVVDAYTADTGMALTYVGVCFDSVCLAEEEGGYELYGYDFFAYKNADGRYYLIPFNEFNGVLNCVYEMIEYPTVKPIWAPAQ